MRYFIELSYKGTNYHGWQRQINARSVQQSLEEAFSIILQKEITVTGAGRTDTGVHASYYVAHADFPDNPIDTEKIIYHVNAILGGDIAVWSLTPVNENTNSRFDAIEREYKYFITKIKNPFRTQTAWRMNTPLNVEDMNRASEYLLLENDFTTFCKLHSDNKTNICDVKYAMWQEFPDGYLFTIRADRFLRNMVRALVGTLVDVGKGRITTEKFVKILSSRDLRLASSSAPACGLFLTDIIYPDSVFQKSSHLPAFTDRVL